MIRTGGATPVGYDGLGDRIAGPAPNPNTVDMPTSSRRLRSAALLLGVIAVAALAACDTWPPTTGVLPGGTRTAGGTGTSTGAYSISPVGQQIVDLTNDERARHGLPALMMNPQLAHAAQLTTDQMSALDTMAHVIPGAPYPAPTDRLSAAGYLWSAWGENIGVSADSWTAADMVTAWIKSPEHEANILNTGFTEIGAAVTIRNGAVWFAEEFGRRQ